MNRPTDQARQRNTEQANQEKSGPFWIFITGHSVEL